MDLNLLSHQLTRGIDDAPALSIDDATAPSIRMPRGRPFAVGTPPASLPPGPPSSVSQTTSVEGAVSTAVLREGPTSSGAGTASSTRRDGVSATQEQGDLSMDERFVPVAQCNDDHESPRLHTAIDVSKALQELMEFIDSEAPPETDPAESLPLARTAAVEESGADDAGSPSASKSASVLGGDDGSGAACVSSVSGGDGGPRALSRTETGTGIDARIGGSGDTANGPGPLLASVLPTLVPMPGPGPVLPSTSPVQLPPAASLATSSTLLWHQLVPLEHGGTSSVAGAPARRFRGRYHTKETDKALWVGAAEAGWTRHPTRKSAWFTPDGRFVESAAAAKRRRHALQDTGEQDTGEI